MTSDIQDQNYNVWNVKKSSFESNIEGSWKCSSNGKTTYPYSLRIFRCNTTSVPIWSLVVLTVPRPLVENGTNGIHQITKDSLSCRHNWLEWCQISWLICIEW